MQYTIVTPKGVYSAEVMVCVVKITNIMGIKLLKGEMLVRLANKSVGVFNTSSRFGKPNVLKLGFTLPRVLDYYKENKLRKPYKNELEMLRRNWHNRVY